MPTSEEPKKPQNQVRDDDLEGLEKVLSFVTFKEVQRLKKTIKEEVEKGNKMNTIWNEKYQRDIIETSKLWGTMMLAKGFLATLSSLQNNKELFIKIGKVFGQKLIEGTPQIFFYGFDIQVTNPWTVLSEDELWAMSHILPPHEEKPLQEQKIYSRTGKWLKARL